MSERTDHAQVPVLPPLVFLGYLIGALLLNWAVPFPTPWMLPLRITGAAAVLAGLLLAGSAFSRLVNAHTSPDPHQPTTALVTHGPYGVMRNPIYAGFFLIYLGFTLLARTLWGLVLSPFLLWTITHAVIHPEEAYLGTKFKEQYKDYSTRVRRWL